MEKEVLATGILGGTIGDYIIKELENDQIKNDFLKTDKESRNCISILHVLMAFYVVVQLGQKLFHHL